MDKKPTYYIGRKMIYFSKNRDWCFGIRLSQNVFCGGQYTEYELGVDFWKWSIGVVL